MIYVADLRFPNILQADSNNCTPVLLAQEDNVQVYTEKNVFSRRQDKVAEALMNIS